MKKNPMQYIPHCSSVIHQSKTQISLRNSSQNETFGSAQFFSCNALESLAFESTTIVKCSIYSFQTEEEFDEFDKEEFVGAGEEFATKETVTPKPDEKLTFAKVTKSL